MYVIYVCILYVNIYIYNVQVALVNPDKIKGCNFLKKIINPHQNKELQLFLSFFFIYIYMYIYIYICFQLGNTFDNM